MVFFAKTGDVDSADRFHIDFRGKEPLHGISFPLLFLLEYLLYEANPVRKESGRFVLAAANGLRLVIPLLSGPSRFPKRHGLSIFGIKRPTVLERAFPVQ